MKTQRSQIEKKKKTWAKRNLLSKPLRLKKACEKLWVSQANGKY